MANQISTTTSSVSTTASVSQTSNSPTANPNQKSKRHFHGKPTGARTGSTSSNKPNQNSRNAKRARWAKKNKPTPRPAVQRGPVYEYICDCHGEPTRKPKASMKMAAKDPESGKMKDKFLGLGKWKCATTGKKCKVTPRKPQPKEISVQYFPTALVQKSVVNESVISGVKIDPFPGKLRTPTVIEVAVADTPIGS